MNLTNPITVTPPPITKSDGSIKTFRPITLNELNITIIDNAKTKRVTARILGVPRSLVLWTQESYDAIGDYTQSQVEAKVLELLVNEPYIIME